MMNTKNASPREPVSPFIIHNSSFIIFHCPIGSFFGGERGIRTLGRVLAVTRFPVVRLRPAQPSLRSLTQLYHKQTPMSTTFLNVGRFIFAFFWLFARVLRTNVRGESANSRKDGEKAAKKAAKKWYIKISI